MIDKIFENISNDIAFNNLSYKEMNDRVNEYSSYLEKQGNGPVLLYMRKSYDFLLMILVCLKAKRCYIPVDSSMPLGRLKDILDSVKVSLIISDTGKKLLGLQTYTINDLKQFNGLRKRNHNNIAYTIFTSGSTGKPKGVQITYNNLNNFIKWIYDVIGIDKKLRVLNTAKFSFDLSVVDVFYSLVYGNTLYVADDYLDVLINEGINLIVATPSLIKLLLLEPMFNCKFIKSLEVIYFCGETLDKHLVLKLYERFPSLKIINAYGPTEATSAVSYYVLDKEKISSFETIPIGNINTCACDIKIIEGEIAIKGESVFPGYLNYDVSFNNGYYMTGDLGEIRDDLLFYLGRKDNQVKYLGYRVDLLDIEENIKRINGVNDCVVIPVYDNKGSIKMFKAFVILSEKVNVREELENILPSYMIPKIIKEVEQFPLNENNKIDRRRLDEEN